MPLPQFLILLALVLIAAALSFWAALYVGVPLAIMAGGALIAAAFAHLATRHHGGSGGQQSGV